MTVLELHPFIIDNISEQNVSPSSIGHFSKLIEPKQSQRSWEPHIYSSVIRNSGNNLTLQLASEAEMEGSFARLSS